MGDAVKDMTIGEAEAYRAGVEAMRAAALDAAMFLEGGEKLYQTPRAEVLQAWSMAKQGVAAAIRALEVKP